MYIFIRNESTRFFSRYCESNYLCRELTVLEFIKFEVITCVHILSRQLLHSKEIG